MSLFSVFNKIENIWKTIAAVWPAVDTFVKQVEGAFPAGTAGATKLAAVESLLQGAWVKIAGIEATFEDVWPALSGAISALVAVYNTAGLFTHKTSQS